MTTMGWFRVVHTNQKPHSDDVDSVLKSITCIRFLIVHFINQQFRNIEILIWRRGTKNVSNYILWENWFLNFTKIFLIFSFPYAKNMNLRLLECLKFLLWILKMKLVFLMKRQCARTFLVFTQSIFYSLSSKLSLTVRSFLLLIK